jgi:hypothetical protein
VEVGFTKADVQFFDRMRPAVRLIDGTTLLNMRDLSVWIGDLITNGPAYTAIGHFMNMPGQRVGRTVKGDLSQDMHYNGAGNFNSLALDGGILIGQDITSFPGANNYFASVNIGVSGAQTYGHWDNQRLQLGVRGSVAHPSTAPAIIGFAPPGNTALDGGPILDHSILVASPGTLDISGSGPSNAYVRINGTLAVTQPIVLPPGSTGAFLPLTGGTVTGATTFSSTVQAGDTTIGTNAGTSARLTLNAPAGNATRNLRWQSGGVNRWSFGPTNNEAATVTTTTTGAVAAGSLVIPVTSAAGIVSGMQISVTGIPSTAYVSFVSGLNVTASTAATGGGIASGATVNFVPNTGADLFLNAINDSGGNWLTPLQITRSTGLLTLSNGLALNNNTMAPTSSTAYTPLLSINETLVGGVVPAGYQHANRININDVAAVGSDTDWTSGGFCGFSLFHNYGGTGFSGGRAAMNVQLAQTGASSFGPKIAGQFMVSANGNQGGTGTTLTTAKGSLYTLSTYARLLPGATNFYLINNEEKDIAVQAGASVAIKSSLTIAQLSNDAVQGSVVDAAFLIGSQAGAVGWLNGFAFGRPDGIWPMAAAATLVGTYRGGTKAMALAHGIDLRDVSFTGNAFASPGWSISGGGVMSLGGMVVTPADTSVAVDVVRSRVTATAIAGGGTAWVVGYAAYDAYGNQWTVSTIGAGGAVTGLTLVSRGYVTGATPANPVTITDQTGQLSATVNLTWATASTLALQPSGGTTTFGGSTNAGQPNFHAILSATQTLTSGVAAKILFNTKTFDSNNAYDNATNYRFTPQLAGKYRVTVNLLVNAAGTANSIQAALLYKNGVEFKRRQEMLANTNSFNNTEALTAIISMNGTTDYLEGWGVVTGTTATVQGGAAYSFFEAQYIGA